MSIQNSRRMPPAGSSSVPRAYFVRVIGGVLNGAKFEVHTDCETNVLDCMRWALVKSWRERTMPRAEIIGRVLRPRIIRAGEPTVYLEEY